LPSERRKFVRYHTREDAFAALGSKFNKVGRIRDISKRGLAFQYIDLAETENGDDTEIEIFLSKNGFHLSAIPCQLVYESSIPFLESSPDSGSAFKVRRCGVKFGRLTSRQRERIGFFLKSHTTGRT
jgi:hypothetical protein